MITYNLRTPIGCENSGCVGVVGENLFATEVFKINGLTDKTLSYSIHLRFSDGSVNSIVPDEVAVDSEGTTIKWTIKKNDIFIHGYFELQIEGRNSKELVFQTEIVRLYADESIPIEDKEYSNPNSENIKLREETYNLLSETKLQQSQIDENLKSIWNTDLSIKEDKANKYSTNPSGTDRESYYPSLAYLDNYYYTQDDTDELLNKKADALTFDSTPTIGSNNPVTSHGVAAALSYKADSKSVTSKADKATTLSGYGITDAYTKDEIEDNYLTIIAGQNINRNIIDLQTKITDLKNDKSDKATTLAGYGITDGLSNTAGAVGTDNIADKSITLEKLKDDFYIDRDHIDDNAVGADEIASQAIGKNHLTLALQNEINGKYDSSNIESGKGSFTYDESITTLKVNYYNYVKIGSICYLEFEISPTSDLTAESLKLTGLPFVSKSYIKHLCATTESHTAGRACIIAADTISLMAAVKTNARVYGSFFYRI
jgi:hypothetical protein